MNSVSAPVVPPSRTTTSRLTASKYSFNLARSWPRNASPNCSITASECISKLARSGSPSASPNLFDYSIRVHLQICSTTAFKFISKPARLQPPISHHHVLQVYLQTQLVTASKCISKLAQLWPPSASLCSLEGERIWRDTRPGWTTQIA